MKYSAKKIISEAFFTFLDKNEQWHFVDMLTGEIFTKSDYLHGKIDLHHINFDKTDLAPDNLCFLFRDNHNFVTKSKHHFIELCNFLTKLLRENVDLLKQNKIPTSWKVGWRKLASKKGITLPSKRYIQRNYRTTITESCQSQKTIDSF